MSYSARVRVLGREPSDIPKMLSAIEEASTKICNMISRGPSWLLVGCNEGLLSAQAKALMPGRIGGTTIVCLVYLSSKDPKWIVEMVERVKTEVNSLGYPVVLEVEGSSLREESFLGGI